MREILNRGYHLGDLVVYNNVFYVIVGKDSIYNDTVVKPENTVYLVEKPNAQEQEFRKRLQSSYNIHMKKILDEQNRKKREYALNKKASVSIVRGDIVRHNYYTFVYFGEASYMDFKGEVKQGHMYIYCDIDKLKGITQLDFNNMSFNDILNWPDIHVSREEDIPVDGNIILKDRIKIYKNKAASLSHRVGHIDIIGNKVILNALFYSWKKEHFMDKRYDYNRSIEITLL